MGCSESKVDIDEPRAIPAQPPKPPATDSRLPLTAREVFRLQKSWKGIKRRIEYAGVELLIGLFKHNNELQSLFKSFKGLGTSDEMRGNEAFAMHGVMVLSAIDDMITGLNDVDSVIQQCKDIRESHGHFQGFTTDLFWNMEQPFLDAVKLTLEDAYNDQMSQIYSIAIHFIIENITGGIPHKDTNGITEIKALDTG